MSTMNLSAPWSILYREIQEMFKDDQDIKVVFDEKNYVISLYVEDDEKAEALSSILIADRYYGNIHVCVRVVPANKGANKVNFNDLEEVFRAAFKNNPALSYTLKMNLPMVSANVYIVFRNKVVQYFNDNLMDVNGFCSTLYQEIAKDIFATPIGVNACYCTDVPENLGKPLGEWP